LRRHSLRVSEWSIRHPAACLAAAGIAVILVILGIGRSETETSFLNNFRPGSRVVRAYADVETHFGGAGVWDVVLDAPPELTTQYLDQVRRLEADLREIDIDGARLTKVLSLADAEEIAARGTLAHLFSPSSRLSAMYLVMPVFFEALMTDPQAGSRQLRIMLRSQEQLGSDQKTALIGEVEKRVQQHLASDAWQMAIQQMSAAAPEDPSPTGERDAGYSVTGYYVLMARLVSQLIGDQWRCFIASGLLVWLLLSIATGSIRLALVALIPNLLPIFLVLALVGLLGGKINMGAAMIAAVSIGLSIDGSVHFLAGYRRSRARGHDSRSSAAHAAGNIGAPVLLATVALVVGFGVLSTSEFIPTATFGTLVAATLALGTAVNLTLLPTLVAWADRERKLAVDGIDG
jgi:predicted RND superfamily exporter protein